jgi:hypothetical protein
MVIRQGATGKFSNIAAAAVITASLTMLGCSSEAQPVDLTPMLASALISQKWSRNELNHFKVNFHSDTLIACGVQNDLWKRVEVTERGYVWNAYKLTEKGNKALFSIDLKDSGKGHEITVRGPYTFEITGIAPGSQPDTRNVELRWEIDWEKAPAEVKACVPKFELSGHEVALFKLVGPDWMFLNYLKPEDMILPDGTNAAAPKLP